MIYALRWPYACLRAKNERFANNSVVEVDGFDGGGGVMMWGAISFNQWTLLVLVPVSLTAQRYMYCDEILQSNLLLVINTQIEVFQHENARSHTARATVAYILPDHNVTVLLWTSKSPDLNPMDHL